jgi:hypothetical protein
MTAGTTAGTLTSRSVPDDIIDVDASIHPRDRFLAQLGATSDVVVVSELNELHVAFAQALHESCMSFDALDTVAWQHFFLAPSACLGHALTHCPR